MTIRQLKPDEVGVIREGTFSFFEAAQLGTLEWDVWEANWRRLLENGRAVILAQWGADGIFNGALGAVIAPDLASHETVAIECFWYMLPDRRGNGIALLKAYENWARAMGCARVGIANLAHVNAERMAKLYQRMGYKPIDVNFQKRLT